MLDPAFALAHATLSRFHSLVYNAFDPVPARIAKARASAAEALRSQPELPETHFAA